MGKSPPPPSLGFLASTTGMLVRASLWEQVCTEAAHAPAWHGARRPPALGALLLAGSQSPHPPARRGTCTPSQPGLSWGRMWGETGTPDAGIRKDLLRPLHP